MQKLLNINTKTFIVLYIFIDLICAGAGMGVPVFCIMLGFPLGWYITGRIFLTGGNPKLFYVKILKFSILTTVFTFFLMVIIWGKAVLMLFDSASDLENFGHPFILYDPKASFIGWLILMIFISPFMQLLTTIFASFITLSYNESKLKQNMMGKSAGLSA